MTIENEHPTADSELGGTRLVGNSEAICKLRAWIRQAASHEESVLIQGPTGSGKELVARLLHEQSKRDGYRFVPVNCGAIPSALIESTLFGHDRGSFTGANRDRNGLIDRANDGTLFLDEIGDASPELQVALLKFLDSGSFYRVGDEKESFSNVRIIAASHMSLLDLVRARKFRDDLYYRLSVIPVRVPSLVEHLEDIPELVRHFATRMGYPVVRIHAKAFIRLSDYSWPGNLRELYNVVARAITNCTDHCVEAQDIIFDSDVALVEYSLPGLSKAMWRTHIEVALTSSSGDVERAAKRLGMGKRDLLRKMKIHSIKV